MNNSIINLRISESLKEDLQILAYTEDKSLSSIARESFNYYLDNSINKDEHIELIQTLGFAELIFWLYDKRSNPHFYEIDELYIQFIELIDSMEQNPLFDNDIMTEFRKVRLELYNYLNGSEYMDTLEFPLNNQDSFNYNKLAWFMYGLRYDENNNKVIHIK